MKAKTQKAKFHYRVPKSHEVRESVSANYWEMCAARSRSPETQKALLAAEAAGMLVLEDWEAP